MDEQRVQAYLSLIQELLECPGGEELQILNGHLELMDEGFMQVCELVAAQLQEEGQDNQAQFLRDVAQEVGQYLNSQTSAVATGEGQVQGTEEDYGTFLIQVFEAIEQSQGNPQVVYPLLQQNLDKLDLTLAETIPDLASQVFGQVESSQAYGIAGVIFLFGNLIQQFPLGNRADNLEIAIACYESVLTVFTREVYPQDWAVTQNNLGAVYLSRIQGEKAENLERAIFYLKASLEVYTREAFPYEWARTQTNLGSVYVLRIQGEPGDNCERSISFLEASLEVYTCESFSSEWAMTQMKLGYAYTLRIRGKREENLNAAIAAYDEAAGILRHLGLDEDLSNTLNGLGVARKIQAEMGIDPGANLERAIAAYDEAAGIWRRLGLDEDLSGTLTNLGNAYHIQVQMGINPGANLESAIAAYDEAAGIRRHLGLDEDLSNTLTNLGLARSTQAQMGIDPGANLERAITALDEAAGIRRHLGLDEDLSNTLTNLGVARSTQAEMGINPGANLERAIAAYDEAAGIRRHLGLDENLSNTLNNLGVACKIQAEMGIDPGANLERAIAAYDEAAGIRRHLGLDEDLSNTLTNLGVARSTQAEMGINPGANLERAIAAYDEAAGIKRRLGLDQGLSHTLNNLGVERWNQAKMGIDPEANLEQAIAALDEAAGIRQRLGLEKYLTETLTNLGNVRCTQAQMGIDPGVNLEGAITAYDKATEIMRGLRLEKDISATLNSLGVARKIQAEMGIDPRANLERAICAYNESAEIRRRLGLARDLARTLNNFGFAYQAKFRLTADGSDEKQQALENAYSRFQEALERVEYLRGEIGTNSEGYKRSFNEEWTQVYVGMVEVCLELGRYTDAIEYVDRSKARNLTELIATRDAYPGGEIADEDRQHLQQLRQAISEEDRRLKQDPNPDYTHISQLREEFQAKYPYKPLKFLDIQSLLDDETVILEWYVLNDKFLTFTLTNHSLNLWTSSEEDLDNLSNWTNPYIDDYIDNNSQWRDSLPQRLETLAQILHLDEILANLRQNFPNCQKLILIPHRFLHLFPLHALPVATEDGEGKFLQDLFPKGVGYAPNCQVLQQAQNRSRPHFNRLFAIQNPTQDLDFTDMEVEAIQSLFNPHQVLKHDQAEKAAIDKETLKNAHCTHFSCHGYFNFQDALKSALILAKSEFTPPPPTDDPSRYLPTKDNKLLDLEKCLTLEDILRLDLTNCRLVTLSACETGITDITSTSDEYIGLPSGFILAGSPNVVSTLWAVADISTAIFMIQFYQTLQNQPELSVVLALRQTQTWLREATVQDLLDWVDGCAVISEERRKQMKRGLAFGNWKKKLDAKRFESPYYWAAFCAIGA